jgi:hypothetical protein
MDTRAKAPHENDQGLASLELGVGHAEMHGDVW